MKIGNRNGGKGNIFQKIINLMPPHDMYIEPFVGGGSVAKNKRQAGRNVLIDMDGEVTGAWREYLSEASPQSAMAAPIAIPDVHRVSPHMASTAVTITNDDASWQVITGDGIAWLKMMGSQLTSRALVYADPPYPSIVRASTRPLYTHEMMTIEEHAAFLDVLLRLDCMVMVSSYHSDLYADMLDGWETAVIPTFTRSHRPVDEIVYMNFPTPDALHDISFLGDNFRERERIKRKAARWSAKWKALPLWERQAILTAMMEGV